MVTNRCYYLIHFESLQKALPNPRHQLSMKLNGLNFPVSTNNQKTMEKDLPQKFENSTVGFYFDATEEQIREHMNRSLEDIFNWLEQTGKFVHQLQNTKERAFSTEVKNIKQAV